MCLLVAQKPGAAPFTLAHARMAHASNSDGIGYAFTRHGHIVIRKPYLDPDKFHADYTADNDRFGDVSPFLLHFRWSTHGEKQGEYNTHPFLVGNKRAAMAHNGILTCVHVPNASRKSDTHVFADILADKNPRKLVRRSFVESISREIGPGNKLAIINDLNELAIFNEGQGTWDGKTWLSNTSWKFSRSDAYAVQREARKAERIECFSAPAPGPDGTVTHRRSAWDKKWYRDMYVKVGHYIEEEDGKIWQVHAITKPLVDGKTATEPVSVDGHVGDSDVPEAEVVIGEDDAPDGGAEDYDKMIRDMVKKEMESPAFANLTDEQRDTVATAIYDIVDHVLSAPVEK